MANAEILRCIRKNIGYVCADGFSSSAGILVNIVELAKVQILQNARCVWLWAGVFAIHFEHMGKEHRVASPAVLLMARANSRPTQTRAESPQRPVALWSPTMSQNHQATPKRLREQVASLRATATRCCSRRLRLRGLRFFLMGLELWKHIVIQFRSKAFFF